MIQSMTGFGTSSRRMAGCEWTIQIKAVNSRYLDVFIKMGNFPAELDHVVRERVKSRVRRGRVDIALEVRADAGGAPASLNGAAARAWVDRLMALKKETGVAGEVSLCELVRLPGVMDAPAFSVGADKETQALVLELVDDALGKLVQMREAEGRNLRAVLEGYLAAARGDMDAISALRDAVKQANVDKVRARIESVLGDSARVDEGRLAQEAAYIANRAEIAEEIQRFFSHALQFEKTLENSDGVGKKLDFILQEMNREINTITSKSDLLDINRLGITVKAELEKIREQVQNIE